MTTIITYYSANGGTEFVAQKVAKELGLKKEHLLEHYQVTGSVLANCDTLIIGCSTWYVNELPPEITPVVDLIKSQPHQLKQIALFGTGNQTDYPYSFVNALGLLYQQLQPLGIDIIGLTSTRGYTFTNSLAVVNNTFVGLPIDEDTQSELTMPRIKTWVAQLKTEFNGAA